MDKHVFVINDIEIVVNLEPFGEGKWATIFVSKPNSLIRVGGDSLIVLRKRLLEGLANPTMDQYKHESRTLRTLCNFSGPHATLFLAEKAGCFALCFQEHRGEFRELLDLTSEQIGELSVWLQNKIV